MKENLIIPEKCKLFKGLEKNKIIELLSHINYKIKKYKKDEIIIFRGEECKNLLIIIEGEVIGEMQEMNGKNKKVDYLEKNSILAPAFLFGENNFYPIDAISQESTILEISLKDFLFIMQKESIILKNYLDIICNKAYFLSEKIWFSFSNKTIRKKIAYYIFKNQKNNIIKFNKSQKEMAEIFGIERPSFSRVLSEFQKENLIEKIDNKNFRINSIENLKEILE